MATEKQKGGDSQILDLAIIGSGISGINTAYRAQAAFPGINYQVFEARTESFGTWSLFKYPGIRSDSDLFSFGFEWFPWDDKTVLAGAENICKYLQRAQDSFGMPDHINYKHRMVSMDWSTKEKIWNLRFKVADGEKEKDVKARWVVLGTGYYDYNQPLSTEIPGLSNFKGKVVHPQFWPKDLDVKGKKVAIIGSGATAMSILPAIAPEVEKVTMVQRSPSYVVTLPNHDKNAEFLKRWIPLSWAVSLLRMEYIIWGYLFVLVCQTFPVKMRNMFMQGSKAQLPEKIDIEPHFNPRYNPWQQRMAFVPDGDFYEALRSGKADMVTGTIERVTEGSIKIKDQPENTLDVDLIVTATGLKVMTGGGVAASIDGKAVRLPDKMLWRNCMVQDLPNCANVFGYANASWTLGADTMATVMTRLMAYQKKHGFSAATATVKKEKVVKDAWLFDMPSTYLLIGRANMFRAGDRYPWKSRQGYPVDMFRARFASLSEEMVFS